MIIVDCKQYDEVYWRVRRGTATASRADRVITAVKGEMSKSAEGYACELVAELYDHDYGPRDEFATAAMRNGTIMEPEARRFYEFTTGQEIRQVGFCLTDDKRFGCSPDGLCGDDGGIELKSPECKTQIRYLLDGTLPLAYKPQVHWHLAVTGRKWWDFMSYYPGLPELLVRVERDEFTQKLEAAMDEFWTLLQNMKRQIAGQRDEVKKLAMAGARIEQPYF